jgi:predicted RNA methylase
MQIETSVLAALSGCRMAGPNLVIEQQLDRKLYVRVAKVLQDAGGKWISKAKAHVFAGDAAEIMEPILLTGEISARLSVAQEFGVFFSPPAVVDEVLLRAAIRPGMQVLEPSAGAGSIAGEAAVAGGIVDCIELLPRNVEELRAAGFARSIQEADFLTIEPEAKYDRIVMNPPFANRADVRHVLHALRFLAPGGRLVAVMSAGVTFRSDKLTVEFRDEIARRDGEIEKLPEGAFKESGTGVNTVLVTAYA